MSSPDVREIAHPKKGEDGFLVEVVDLNAQPSTSHAVGPFRDEGQAKAWQPGRGYLVAAVRPLEAPWIAE